jgi:hypothetical protein
MDLELPKHVFVETFDGPLLLVVPIAKVRCTLQPLTQNPIAESLAMKFISQ